MSQIQLFQSSYMVRHSSNNNHAYHEVNQKSSMVIMSLNDY